jgi:signal transduction histidine kinase
MQTQGKLARHAVRPDGPRTELSYFLSAAAHDLRNPISGILSASECLLEELPEAPEEQLTLLQAIQSSSRLVLRLIDDLLESSAAKPAKLHFHFEPTDLISVVKQDLALNELIARRKRVHLDLSTGGFIPLMEADSEKVHQVVDNLLKNAIESSQPDGRVEIRIETKGDQVILSVGGQAGPGPAKTKRRLLQGKSDAAQEIAVITRIVHGHGGHLRLENRPGKGSRFTITFPAKPVDTSAQGSS